MAWRKEVWLGLPSSACVLRCPWEKRCHAAAGSVLIILIIDADIKTNPKSTGAGGVVWISPVAFGASLLRGDVASSAPLIGEHQVSRPTCPPGDEDPKRPD